MHHAGTILAESHGPSLPHYADTTKKTPKTTDFQKNDNATCQQDGAFCPKRQKIATVKELW